MVAYASYCLGVVVAMAVSMVVAMVVVATTSSFVAGLVFFSRSGDDTDERADHGNIAGFFRVTECGLPSEPCSQPQR